jgi:hypothetical protein
MLYLARLTGFVALILLVGCETIHYDYYPPASDQGRMCVTQCGAIKEICKGNEIQRAQSEKEICERSNASNYRACMRNAKNKDQQKSCDSQKRHCWASENFYACEADYRRCYVNCGGNIREYKE